MGLNNTGAMRGHRLVCTKYPAINLFDDVASADEFELLYELQALTNPRLKDEVGDIQLIHPSDVPYACERNRSYAVAPFTHINPMGGRFNDGLFGALYIASDEYTAAAEVKHHQQAYYSNVEGLEFERIVFRSLIVTHEAAPIHVVTKDDKDILDSVNYSHSQQLARTLKKKGFQAVKYPSVRNDNGVCMALFTPKPVLDVVQAHLIEMIWDGEKISDINHISHI
jgi:RES domain-containing protein